MGISLKGVRVRKVIVKVITALLEATLVLLKEKKGVKLIVASKKKRLTFTFPFVHHQSHDWKVEH